MVSEIVTFPPPVQLELRDWETLIRAVQLVADRSRTSLGKERRRVVGLLVEQLATGGRVVAGSPMSEPGLVRPRTRVGNSREAS